MKLEGFSYIHIVYTEKGAVDTHHGEHLAAFNREGQLKFEGSDIAAFRKGHWRFQKLETILTWMYFEFRGRGYSQSMTF